MIGNSLRWTIIVAALLTATVLNILFLILWNISLRFPTDVSFIIDIFPSLRPHRLGSQHLNSVGKSLLQAAWILYFAISAGLILSLVTLKPSRNIWLLLARGIVVFGSTLPL